MITQGYLPPPNIGMIKGHPRLRMPFILFVPLWGGLSFYFVNFLPFWMYIPLGRVSFDVPT